jgi:hypothetical protein
MNGEVVFLFLSDVDRILRILYHGSRPPHVKYLLCSCGRIANLTTGDAEAIGWQILPHAKCPFCLHPKLYQGNDARERFLRLVASLAPGTAQGE